MKLASSCQRAKRVAISHTRDRRVNTDAEGQPQTWSLSAISARCRRPESDLTDGVAGDAIANARRGPADKAIAHSGRSLRPVLGIVGVSVLLHDGVDDPLSDVDHELADPGAGAVELSAGDPFVAIRNP